MQAANSMTIWQGHYGNKLLFFITIAFSASDLWHLYYVIISPSLYVIFVIFIYIHLFIHEIVCYVL